MCELGELGRIYMYTVSVEQMRWQTSCVTGKSKERVFIVDLGERSCVSEANKLPIEVVQAPVAAPVPIPANPLVNPLANPLVGPPDVFNQEVRVPDIPATPQAPRGGFGHCSQCSHQEATQDRGRARRTVVMWVRPYSLVKGLQLKTVK